MTVEFDASADGEPPAHRTYLHIGTYKTGTSFIQSVLLRNRDLLSAAGTTYPTDHMNWGLQVRATRDLLGQQGLTDIDGAWERMVAIIQTADTPQAVVSMERLSVAPADRALALIESLQPSEVHVIVTLRDLVRLLPSDWQSSIKQGRTWSFSDYVSAAAGEPGSSAANRSFWEHHDAPEIVKRWMPAVGPGRLHIVTVPPSGAPPSLLWERFSSVMGLTAADYDITQDLKSNFSLSFSDTEFLRKINREIGNDLGKDARKKWVTRYIANKVLRPESTDVAASDRVQLTQDEHDWATGRAKDIVAQLKELDVDVIGDLDELIPVPRTGLGNEPTRPAVDFPDRAAEIVADLLRKLVEVETGVQGGGKPLRPQAQGKKTGKGGGRGADRSTSPTAAQTGAGRPKAAKRAARLNAAAGGVGRKRKSGAGAVAGAPGDPAPRAAKRAQAKSRREAQ